MPAATAASSSLPSLSLSSSLKSVSAAAVSSSRVTLPVLLGVGALEDVAGEHVARAESRQNRPGPPSGPSFGPPGKPGGGGRIC